MLWTLVLTNPKCVETDFSSPPWNNASLVTPCHEVRQIWNDVALHKHRQEAQSIILECQAEDTIKGQPLTLRKRYAALLMRRPKVGTKDKPPHRGSEGKGRDRTRLA